MTGDGGRGLLARESSVRGASVTAVDPSIAALAILEEASIARYAAMGVPAIANTSFNRQEPFVETPAQDVRTFGDMPIECLSLGERLLVKNEPPRRLALGTAKIDGAPGAT